MKSRLTTVSLVLALSAFGAGGAYAGASSLGIVHGQSHAHHGKALSHGKTHGRKHRGKALCHGKKHALSTSSGGEPSRSSAVAQYGTRPGKGCGDTNHVHTGPPGNPSNTQCPPQSRHG